MKRVVLSATLLALFGLLACDNPTPAGPASVESVAVTPPAATLLIGGSLQLTVTLQDRAGDTLSGHAVVWTSDNPNVAAVTSGGMVTAIAAGTATVTAASEGRSGAASIAVSLVPVASVTITPDAVALTPGISAQLVATAWDAGAHVLPNRPATWSTSDPAVALVSTTGLVTGVAPGTTMIVATIEGARDTATVSVTPVGSPADIGDLWDWTERYSNPVCADTGSYLFNNQTGATFTGSSQQVGVCFTSGGQTDNTSGPDVVTNGQAGAATISFLVNGVCSYQAAVSGNPPDHLSGTTTCGSSSGTWEAVRHRPVAAVTVAPGSQSLLEGQTVQLAAELRDATGNRLFFRPVAWSTDNPAVAGVSADGVALAHAAGTATITAAADGRSGTATIVVLAAGHLRVTTATSGIDADPDGYRVFVSSPFWWDGSIATTGALTVSGVSGDWTVELTNLAVNCAVNGANRRTIPVPPVDTTTVAFDVTCGPVSHLAYVSESSGQPDIYSSNSNGTSGAQLTFDPAQDVQPAWSPDGARLAFTSYRDGNAEIYVMNADGTNPVRLTTDPAYDGDPAWSPDGAKLAFRSDRDGNEIYVMDADGTNLQRLTTNAAFDGEPDWSPDGTKIAFTTNRDGNAEIYVMNADGGNPVRLTNDAAYDASPAWSPDGTKIAFARGDQGIMVMNADGSGAVPVYAAAGSGPVWSPDGTKLAFSVWGCDYYNGCYSDILAVNLDGTGLILLVGDYTYDLTWKR